MDIGTGIAIAGVWVFPVAAAFSRTVTSKGMLLSLAVAIGVTCLLKYGG